MTTTVKLTSHHQLKLFEAGPGFNVDVVPGVGPEGVDVIGGGVVVVGDWEVVITVVVVVVVVVVALVGVVVVGVVVDVMVVEG